METTFLFRIWNQLRLLLILQAQLQGNECDRISIKKITNIFFPKYSIYTEKHL